MDRGIDQEQESCFEKRRLKIYAHPKKIDARRRLGQPNADKLQNKKWKAKTYFKRTCKTDFRRRRYANILKTAESNKESRRVLQRLSKDINSRDWWSIREGIHFLINEGTKSKWGVGFIRRWLARYWQHKFSSGCFLVAIDEPWERDIKGGRRGKSFGDRPSNAQIQNQSQDFWRLLPRKGHVFGNH